MVPVLRARVLPLLAAVLSAGPLAGSAGAHGGTTLATGRAGDARIVVQGADLPDGSGGVDLSVVLTGPGSGPASRVTFWVRPVKGREFRVRATRDDGGTHHVEVARMSRGAWRDWDVSAIVRLAGGRTVRVSTDRRDPPGPDPTATTATTPTTPDDDETTPGSGDGATTPDAGATTAPDATAPTAQDDAPVDVTDDGDDGAPGWVVPSVIVLALLAGGVVVLRRGRD
ncbi:MAG: hypothetical protein M0P31_05640 [Solirubrobacteraceae bacterium]|nr:hypothetical protein [Solirubrobacteraceae bacterium]